MGPGYRDTPGLVRAIDDDSSPGALRVLMELGGGGVIT